MSWYVLQTTTGSEEKLVEMIRRMVPRDFYGECFVVYHEQLWRRQQQNFVHVKRAFPGYVFITSREPKALFFCLKKIPAMTKMMVDDESFFLSLDPEESAFLEKMMDERHVIGLSYLETNGKGKIYQVSGPLCSCISQVVRCRFGRRYVIVRLQLLGKEKDVLLGILLKEDICQEMKYGKVEAPVNVPEKYRLNMDVKSLPESSSLDPLLSEFSVGDAVLVTDGAFGGMSGRVYEIKNQSVNMGIRLFGRDIEMEMPMKLLRKA